MTLAPQSSDETAALEVAGVQVEDAKALIARRYRVEATLGRGGMAEVYRVVDEVTGRQVALKQLIEEGSDSRRRESSTLFEREFHTLAQLAHPRVIAVYDYGVDEGRPYYTMECLDGDDLRALAPVPWRQACVLLRDVCSSLALLHSRRLVHRDLSPRNVRCTSDGRAKLIDFGALASMAATSAIVGTPAYMAPEVVHGQLLDARADLFALGALAYWTLTGRHAYPVRQVRQLRDAWRSPPPRPSTLAADVPEALDALVMSLLMIDPLARPTSAAEVISRLSAIADLPPAEDLVAQAYLTTPTLVGRDDAQLSFRKRMLRAVRGIGGSILVEAERGMGRSRLLATYVLEAKLAGALVLRGAGEAEATAPYSLVRRLVSELDQMMPELARSATPAQAKYLSRVLPDLYPGDHAVAPVEFPNPGIQEALLDWFLGLSRQLTLCVAVDDLHQADAASAALIARLANHAPEERLVIAATRCSGEEGAAARAVKQVARAGARLLLRPLGANDTLALARSVFGDVPHLEATAEWLHRLSRGNPGSCMELAQHLVDRSVARFEQGAWTLPSRPDGEALPESFEQALAERIAAASEPARFVIELMSVVTPHAPLSLGDYVKVLESRFDHETSFHAFDELATMQVLTRADESYAVRDRALLRAVERGLPETRKRELHRSLAEHYASEPRVGALVTTHHEFHAGLIERAFERYTTALENVLDISSTDALFGRSAEGTTLLEALYARSMQLNEAPAALYRWRKVLLQIAAVEKPSLERHADATIAQLRQDVGLIYWDQIDEPDPLQRIGRCLERALATHEATAVDERGLHPLEAVRELAVVTGLLTGITARTMDTRKMSRLPALIEPLVPLSPVVPLLSELTQVAVDSVVRGADVMQRRAHVVQQLGEPVEGMDELTRQGAYNLMSFYLGLEEAVLTDPAALSRADAMERHPNYASLAWQVRMLYHLYRGDAKNAERCRNQRELLSLQHVDSDQHLTRSLIHELHVYVLSGDLLGVKRTAARLADEAREYAGWRPWDQYAQAALHEIQNDFDRAGAALERCLSLAAPLEHQAWPYARAMQALIACKREDGAAAVAIVDEVLGTFEDAGITVHDPGTLICARALGQTLQGDYAGGAAAVEALIDEAEASAREGVYVGHLLEARARLALAAADAAAFEEFARRAGRELRGSRNPVLVAKYERLITDARRRQQEVPGEAPTLDAPSTALTTGLGTLATSVHTLLGACRGPQERAYRSIEVLVTEAKASGGYLFGIVNGQLDLLASRHAPPADPALTEEVERFYQESLAQADDEGETQTDSDEIERTHALGDPDQTVLGSLYPYCLRSYAGGRQRVAGVAVLIAASEEPPALHWEILTSVTQALLQAGDVDQDE